MVEQQSSTEQSNSQESEILPNLDGKYKVRQYLDSGANDDAYLVEGEDGQKYVALFPITDLDSKWKKTLSKFVNAQRLIGLGLKDHIADKVELGTLTIDNKKRKVVITEYAGENILEVQNEKEKIDALKQIRSILETLHQAQLGVTDFKPDHWLVQRQPDNSILVKLIDYTNVSFAAEKIHQSGGRSPEKRQFDFNALKMLVNTLFPWFQTEKYTNKLTIEESERVYEQMLKDLEDSLEGMGKWQKQFQGFFRSARRRF